MTENTTPELQAIYDLFDAHCGTWEGIYLTTDALGNRIDFHSSLLELQRIGNKWRQKNVYTWENGKSNTFEFEGTFNAKGELEFNTERLIGKAWKSGDTVLLQWEYQDGVSNRNFEQINLLQPGSRMRSWQLSREGRPSGHVLISETQTSKDCPSFE